MRGCTTCGGWPRGCLPARIALYRDRVRAAVIILVVMIVALIAALLLVRPGADRPGPVHVPRAEARAVDGWEHAWHAALARAANEGRPILADFTGSDWCPPCMQLRRDVFAAPAFRAWAERRVVLLELDYPMRQAQAADVAAQNEALQRHFAIAGYPSILVLTAEGVELGRLERVPTAPEAFIAAVEAIIDRPR